MRLPIDASGLSAIVIGDPLPVLEYGTDKPKTDVEGRPLFRVPVLLSGTGERRDPTTTITVPGPLPQLGKGQPAEFDRLTISTWTVTNGGRERSGVTLRAAAVRGQAKR